jgi:hypothetical protein
MTHPLGLCELLHIVPFAFSRVGSRRDAEMSKPHDQIETNNGRGKDRVMTACSRGPLPTRRAHARCGGREAPCQGARTATMSYGVTARPEGHEKLLESTTCAAGT